LRIALRVASDAKVLACVATDKEIVKRVLLELLYTILDSTEKE